MERARAEERPLHQSPERRNQRRRTRSFGAPSGLRLETGSAMIDLSLPPERLARGERRAIVIATAVVAFTRLLALARGPWDWDEMLFLLGLRDYDVALHHPHPPGFPLFVLAAKLLVSSGLEPFVPCRRSTRPPRSASFRRWCSCSAGLRRPSAVPQARQWWYGLFR